MDETYMLPTPLVQAIGVVAVPGTDKVNASVTERKPVAAAVLTMRQRPDGHVEIVSQTVSAAEETQFPLPWLVEQQLIANAPTLIAPADATLLFTEAARFRFFVEPKLAGLASGDANAIDVTRLVDGAEPVDEAALCRKLEVPRLTHGVADVQRMWTWFPKVDRAPVLGAWALGQAVTRLMLWANLAATRAAEPGLFYEPMLALRSFLEERHTDAPDIVGWATSKPVMRAVSYEQDYRRDLAHRLAGEPSDWPAFQDGQFYY